jgi:hypothetical protein
MDANDRVGFENCPSCGGATTVGSLEPDLREIECPNGCTPPIGQTPASAADRILDAISGVEVLMVHLEQAILDTAATFALTDPRAAAELVADAYAEVLLEEGRSLRSVELMTAAVRRVGERMHHRNN